MKLQHIFLVLFLFSSLVQNIRADETKDVSTDKRVRILVSSTAGVNSEGKCDKVVFEGAIEDLAEDRSRDVVSASSSIEVRQPGTKEPPSLFIKVNAASNEKVASLRIWSKQKLLKLVQSQLASDDSDTVTLTLGDCVTTDRADESDEEYIKVESVSFHPEYTGHDLSRGSTIFFVKPNDRGECEMFRFLTLQQMSGVELGTFIVARPTVQPLGFSKGGVLVSNRMTIRFLKELERGETEYVGRTVQIVLNSQFTYSFLESLKNQYTMVTASRDCYERGGETFPLESISAK